MALALLPLVTTQTVTQPWLWALPFLFTFAGGVFADVLESRYRKLFLALAALILITQAALCVAMLPAIAQALEPRLNVPVRQSRKRLQLLPPPTSVIPSEAEESAFSRPPRKPGCPILAQHGWDEQPCQTRSTWHLRAIGDPQAHRSRISPKMSS